MSERNWDLMDRRVWTTLGTALLLAAVKPRANRRFRQAGIATAGCGVAILVVAVGLVGLGIGLLVASALVPRRRPA